MAKDLASAEARAADAEIARVRDLNRAERKGAQRVDATHARFERERIEWEEERTALQRRVDKGEEARDAAVSHARDADDRIYAIEERLRAADFHKRRTRRVAAGVCFLV